MCILAVFVIFNIYILKVFLTESEYCVLDVIISVVDYSCALHRCDTCPALIPGSLKLGYNNHCHKRETRLAIVAKPSGSAPSVEVKLT